MLKLKVSLADRIWSIGTDWESLIKKRKLSLSHCSKYVVNKITGNKEVANLLHECGHKISYADIRHLVRATQTK